MTTHRRRFLQVATAGLAAATAQGSTARAQAAAKRRLTLGVASYTWRKFPVESAIAMTKRLGLEKIVFKSMHLPLDSTPDQIAAVVEKVKAAGLDLYGCGVVYMKTEAEVQQAFDYARIAGMSMIVGVPNYELMDAAEARVKDSGIRLAIHNHGPDNPLFPSPQSAFERIKDRDPRMGLCIDVGHTRRLGLDPAEEVRKYAARLFDIHIKDVSAADASGKTVEIGRGVIDIPALLRTLIAIDYSGVLALEFEKDEADPLPGAAESIGYLRGALAILT
jgi:inosose dehydratase